MDAQPPPPTAADADRARELAIETLASTELAWQARVADLEAALRTAAGERDAYRELAHASIAALYRLTIERDQAREARDEARTSLRDLRSQRADQRRAA